MLQQKSIDALRWITEIFNNHKIPFRIAGGLAAKIYGATRELADIDTGIPEARFYEIIPDVKEYIIWGPQKYLNENWDLLMMTLNYKGQEIDVCACDTEKIFNHNTKEWEYLPAGLENVVMREIEGIKVPVMPIKDLVSYKNKLQREVDISDVKELSDLK